MKLILLSFCIYQMLYYILLCFILLVVTGQGDTIDMLSNKRVNDSVDYLELFQDNSQWKTGDIPLLNRKIFRGTRVTIREHPYIVSIRRQIVHYSVGAMLTRNLFITVAHPLIDVPLDELGVVVGENYSDRGATLLNVVLVIIHENFDRYTLAADLALLRVYEDTPLRCSVKYIQLINPHKNINFHRAFVTGWGRCDRTGRELCLPRSSKYTPGEKLDPMLRSVSFPVKHPNAYCDGYKQNGVTIQKGMVCVGQAREEHRVTSCLAVPGAPLVVSGQLVGLQSWGYGCGYQHDLPLVYTSVQYYQPWLLHNVPLIRLIKQNHLTKLFEAKRAYVLTKWLNLTRVIRPDPFLISDKPMEMMKLDKDLARLKGHVYDIRDILFNGIHHRYKLKLYAKLRHRQWQKDLYIIKLHETISTEEAVPFIVNITESMSEEEAQTDESLYKDTPESDDSYKSYDEYAK